MIDIDQRLGRVEERLDSITGEVRELRGEVKELRSDVTELRGDMTELRGEVGGLKTEVHRLSLLYDVNAAQLQLVAEVQVRHGDVLDDVRLQLEPLRELHAFVRTIAGNHESRIQALEERHRGL